MSTVTAVSPLQDTNKSIVSLLLSLSPLYFLISSRSRLGLDGLHVGLLQVVLLLVLRAGLDLVPSGLRRTPAPAPAPVVVVQQPPPSRTQVATVDEDDGDYEKDGVAEKKKRTKRRRVKAAPAAAPPPPFPAGKLDETVANFLHITAPTFLTHIAATSTTSIPSAPLSEWKSTYQGDNVEVLQHPKLASLFGICATFPDVPLRQLFQVLQDVGSRAKWDSMAEGADEIERFEVEGRRGNCLHMRMKGMAMVKAKDLVLLSVANKLPTADDSPAPGKAVADKLRIFAATTSVDHPRVPPTPAYNRMELSVSGFLIEEVGAGSRIVQITDLSGLGSWIPGAVIRTITQSMLPKSLVKLGAAAAATTDLTADYPPPTLGVYASAPPAAAAADADDGASSSGSETSDDEDDLPTPPSTDLTPPPSSSRDVAFLLAQLRSVTSRLAALETLVASPSSPSAAGARPWYALGLGGRAPARRKPGAAAAAETDTALLSGTTLGALATLGSAAAAAVAVAALAAWGKRRH
ncbi:hypothetical protein JCM10450v2_004493 [Rhodotorula kratochvilovae]